MTIAALVTAMLLATAPLPATPSDAPAGASIADQFGHVQFANSGAPAAQRDFLDGLALLHDFEYDSAAAAFRRAEAADPGFAMAYWGEAMTFNHAVWMEQDLASARAALAKLGATPADRRARAKTPREAGYLDALETLYGDGSKVQRDDRYAAAMLALHARYPDDVDATAFAALAVLGTAHAGRDYAIYMRAAAMLEAVFPTHQTHPGVVHYLIHSYDDPVHAPLGLRPARLYGTIAPQAGHALHMTSHIFVALGMWHETVDANLAAIRVVNEQRQVAGKPPARCGHYSDWLDYAWLQLGDIAAARAVEAGCRPLALAELARGAGRPIPSGRSAMVSYYEMVARRGIEFGGAAPDEAPPLPDGTFLASAFRLVYARAITGPADPAALSAQAGTLHLLVARIRDEAAKLPPEEAQSGDADVARLGIMADQVDALALLAAGHSEPGFAALKALVARESALPADFGPPEILKPSAELLGDRLAAAGKAAEAVAAYRVALSQAPNRRLSRAGN